MGIADTAAAVLTAAVLTATAACGVAAPTVRFTAYQIGSNYYLSKRTNLYAAFGASTTTSSTSGVSGSGANANQYTIGARHTF